MLRIQNLEDKWKGERGCGSEASRGQSIKVMFSCE